MSICDSEVYKNGKVVVAIGSSKSNEMEKVTKKATKVFNIKCDWHLYCGYYLVRALVETPEALLELQKFIVNEIGEINNYIFYDWNRNILNRI